MVICECGGELEIIRENEKVIKVICTKCGKVFNRRWYDKKLFEFRKKDVWVMPMLSDIWRVFRREGVKFTIKKAPFKGYWFHWWTPIWHFRKGPYITIGLWKFRLYRGY